MEKIKYSNKAGNMTGADVLVCFSHLRWNFVYQRPQHLMSRLTEQFKVFFVEEPIFHEQEDTYRLELSTDHVWIITPLLQQSEDNKLSVTARQKALIDQCFQRESVKKFVAWYYTPMALKFTNHLKPELTVYDCMDELSAFKFAPAELRLMEAELFKRADVVFTGGYCLYEAKKHAHQYIFPFPSSIDKPHFYQARDIVSEPADQAPIQGIRMGFYGVIDERFNIKLIEEVAIKKPEWQIVLIGPVIKIDEALLPRYNNIHYLGSKSYKELPHYLAGWDIALIPFEKNESTKYISPTKTPEYLAAGKPVISTSITDVVTPYGVNALVHIADDADTFIAVAEKELSRDIEAYHQWLMKVDEFLKDFSWDATVDSMMCCINDCASPVKSNAPGKNVVAFKSVA